MLHKRGFCGEDIKVFGRGKSATNDDGIALVGNPAAVHVKVGGVVAVLIEGENGNETYTGLGNV